MRDVVHEVGSLTYETTTRNWNRGNASYNLSHLFKQSARSDIRTGNHISPLPNNAYFYDCEALEFECFRPSSTRYRCRGKLGNEGSDSFYYLDQSDSSVYMMNLENQVLGELLTKVTDSSIDVGVFIGELPETLQQIHAGVQRLLNAYKAVRKGNLKAARKAFGSYAKHLPSNLSKEWLSWSLGWKPMISDIYGAIEYLQSEPVRERELVQVTRKKIVNIRLTPNGTYQYGGTPEKGCKAGVYYRVDDAFYATLNALGLINPAVVAWELLPASFVIDYLIPVGNFLDQLDSGIGLDYAYGYSTRWTKGESLKVQRTNGFPSSLYSGGVYPSWSVSFGQHNRTNLPDWPRPRMYIKSTGNFNSLSITSALLLAR